MTRERVKFSARRRLICVSPLSLSIRGGNGGIFLVGFFGFHWNDHLDRTASCLHLNTISCSASCVFLEFRWPRFWQRNPVHAYCGEVWLHSPLHWWFTESRGGEWRWERTKNRPVNGRRQTRPPGTLKLRALFPLSKLFQLFAADNYSAQSGYEIFSEF